MQQHIHIDKLTPNQGILNFSHLLDAPAGKHGFVLARNGHLFFEDGQRVRFLASISLPVPIRRTMPQPKSWRSGLPAWVSM